MSAVVVGNRGRFPEISKRLEGIGITECHLYDPKGKDGSVEASCAFPPVDFVVLGRDAGDGEDVRRVLIEVKARRIPVISEDRICARVAFP